MNCVCPQFSGGQGRPPLRANIKPGRDYIRLYRKRFIPDQTDCLDKDEIIGISDNRLITRWRAIKPRGDIGAGVSCYYIDKNIKVSKIYDAAGDFKYYYCDIIETERNADGDYIFSDLLLDVIIYADGSVKVIDAAEVADALDLGLIDVRLAKKALRALDYLLNEIYEGRFKELSKPADEVETEGGRQKAENR